MGYSFPPLTTKNILCKMLAQSQKQWSLSTRPPKWTKKKKKLKTICAWLCRQTAKRAKAWQKLNIKDSDHLSSFCYPVKSTLGFYIRSATCGNMRVTVEIFIFLLSLHSHLRQPVQHGLGKLDSISDKILVDQET